MTELEQLLISWSIAGEVGFPFTTYHAKLLEEAIKESEEKKELPDNVRAYVEKLRSLAGGTKDLQEVLAWFDLVYPKKLSQKEKDAELLESVYNGQLAFNDQTLLEIAARIREGYNDE